MVFIIKEIVLMKPERQISASNFIYIICCICAL